MYERVLLNVLINICSENCRTCMCYTHVHVHVYSNEVHMYMCKPWFFTDDLSSSSSSSSMGELLFPLSKLLYSHTRYCSLIYIHVHCMHVHVHVHVSILHYV